MTKNFNIRHLSTEEGIKILHFLSNYAFTPTPPLPEFDSFAEHQKKHTHTTYYAVFEDETPQAIADVPTPMTQNLRGGFFKMGGVADVATHPAGRRKGYVRAMMRAIYQSLADDGYAVSCLYPFRESFYERLGYVTLTQVHKAIFKPEGLAPLLKKELPGRFELKSINEGFAEYRQFLERIQPRLHGMSLFQPPQEEATRDRKTWLVMAKHKGKIVGIMQYKLTDKMMDQTLKAYDFLYTEPLGKLLLLNWIARHIDQVSNVELWLPPGTASETLYTDITPDFGKVFVAPMGRVINLKKLSGMPIGPGAIRIGLTDEDCDWHCGVWFLSSDQGKLAVEKAQKADFDLTIQGLSALIYGVCDPNEFELRGWGNPNPEQQTILRKMFPPASPFIHAMY
jgi:predicted acetyltransferase